MWKTHYKKDKMHANSDLYNYQPYQLAHKKATLTTNYYCSTIPLTSH